MTRRGLLSLPSLLLAQAPTRPATALSLNEDNSHYFFTRAGQDLTPETVASFVDQYAGTQVRELILNGNSQRTSFASKVWDPVWKDYDPEGSDDQPLFSSSPKEGRATARKWVHTAWSLHQRGIDPYALWIRRAREKKLSPWISMRMNDLHNVDDPESYLHSSFWKRHPEFRRMQWRGDAKTTVDWRDRAFDYLHEEVREYHFKLVEEYCERYDFDGLELDWMRFGFHFKPGQEARGVEALNVFMRRTRELLNAWEKKRGHKIALGARVPSRPHTAWAMGMDGARWAREGLIQMLVATPFWASIETDMPLELWRKLIGDGVTLAAGLELLIRPYHDYKIQSNNLETVRGAAAALLARGADRVYLFNYMDSQTAIEDIADYPKILRECGSLSTLEGKPRRHVVTYSDTWAPGEAQGSQLPKTVRKGGWAAFRVFVGPGLREGRLRLEADGEVTEVRANGGEPLSRVANGAAVKPGPAGAFMEWRIGTCEGWIVIDLHMAGGGKIHWVEIFGA